MNKDEDQSVNKSTEVFPLALMGFKSGVLGFLLYLLKSASEMVDVSGTTASGRGPISKLDTKIVSFQLE